MYEKVEAWVDLVKLEHRVFDFWQQTDAFNKLREQNAGKKHWSFLDGPITANNPMGVHHAWGRTLKDCFLRYHAMQGFDLRHQNGFDCQGLWVEVEVEKEHGFNSKKDIEEFGIDRFVEECKARVRKFADRITKQSERLGYWMDWTDSYFTMSDENNYTIWTFLKKCHERGKIYRGNDVMPWSGRSGTGYSQMEVVDGRKLVTHKAVFVKFPLRGREKENLLVWTTTPWTLTSNVGAMVNADLEYVKLRAKFDGEIYYFAAENLKYQRLENQFKEKRDWVDGVPKLKTLAEVFDSRGGYEIEGRVRGSEMLGWEYDGPFDELEAQQVAGGYPYTDPEIKESGAQAHRVIDGGRDNKGNPIVVAGEGTGIVHTAPGCGDIDHIIGKKLGLPQLAPLNEEALFLDKFGGLQGKHAMADETVKWILDSLEKKGLLVHVEVYPHVYPHCWRSGDPLVFRLVDEWYIKMDWRDEIKKHVDEIRWIPEWGAEREHEWLDNMRDWMISKKRYWGLALPIWVCEKCDHWAVIGSRDELQERATAGWDEFEGHSPHRPWIDKVKIACEKCGATASRIPDVGNPWLDAGIVPYSTAHYDTDREYWEKWMPADLVLECFPGQFRNWFYALLAMSTMMENVRPFKTLVGHALVKDEDGKEMHKSTGNAIWFDDAADEMGADVMRWMYCSNEYESDLLFGFGPAKEVRGKIYNTLWNSYSFFVNYARLDDFTPPAKPSALSKRSPFDRWILSRLHTTIEAVRASFDEYRTRAACQAIHQFIEDLSNWYIRKNRRRFWKGENKQDQLLGYETLYECLYALVRLVAPIMPFTAEEIYQNLVRSHDKKAPESVHHTGFPEVNAKYIDTELNEDMAAVQRLTSLALSAREAGKIKVRQPLAKLSIGPADKIEKRGVERYGDLLKEELNVKLVEVADPESAAPEAPVEYVAKPNLKILGKRLGPKLKDFKPAFNDIAPQIAADYQAGAEAFVVKAAGEEIGLSREEILLKEQGSTDAAIAKDGASWASFDTVITEELRLEGLMREVLRRLQVLRKDSGLEIEDRIELCYQSESKDMLGIFEKYGDLLKTELLAVSLEKAKVENSTTYKIDGQEILISIKKNSA